MKRPNLGEMPTTELANRFVEIGIAQYEASLDGNTKKYNRLYDEMKLITEELKSRPGDQRSMLVPFLHHRNAQVRLKAAIHTLAIAPDAARQALALIWDRREYPPAADARGMLDALDQGRFVPT